LAGGNCGLNKSEPFDSRSAGGQVHMTTPSKLLVIAVIDDDASVRVGTENLLSSLGYTVHTFASAEAFLKSGLRYDTLCVIADVRMPGMSGIELQTLLLTKGHHVPFIFVTSFSEEAVRVQALIAGPICFLTKPFDRLTLVRCLDTVLATLDGHYR
jgi:FixJ family two-component response regulator